MQLQSKSLFLTCAVSLLSFNIAMADSITKPNTFTAGTPAKAEEVNANFDTVYNQVNKVGTVINIDDVNGRVAIGTPTPSERLEVAGTVKATAFVGNGSGLTDINVSYNLVASDTMAFGSVSSKTVDTASYTKYKEAEIIVTGAYRVYFEVRNTTTSGETYAKLYKNGSAIGVERNNGNTSFVGYSQDLFFTAGDLVQLYCYKTVDNGEIKNLQFRATVVPKGNVTMH